VIRTLVDLRDGKVRSTTSTISAIAGCARSRADGKSYRIGLLRMERAIKERMSSVDIDTVMPQDLINAKPAGCRRARVLRLLAALAVHGSTNPLSESRISGACRRLGPGGLTRERAGLSRIRGRAPTHTGAAVESRRRKAEYRLINSLADLCAGEQYGFRRDALPQGQGWPRHRRGDLSLGDGGGALHVAQANSAIDAKALHRRSRRRAACRRRPAHSARQGWISWTFAEAARFGAARFIPFLENDDANRALMGSNMQRQRAAVRAEAPSSAPAWRRCRGATPARRSPARRTGVVDQVDATSYRHSRHRRVGVRPSRASISIGAREFQRSNQTPCINQRPLVKVADQVNKATSIADGPLDRPRELRLAATCCRVHARGMAITSKTDPALRADRQGRRLHLDPYRGNRSDGTRQPSSGGGNHPRYSNGLGRDAEESRRGRHRLYRRGSPRRRPSLSQDHAKGESPMTPEEKPSARHLRREGHPIFRDT